MQAHMRAYTHARMQWTLAETCMRMELWRRSMSISSLRASSRAIPDRIAALGRWGYYSAVSFTDSNVGMVLDAVDSLGLTKTTVVAFR